MTTKELTAAFIVAKNKYVDLTNEDIDIFYGFGLKDFKPVYVTINQVAKLIRWQAGTFNGGWDADAINEIGYFGRKRFLII